MGTACIGVTIQLPVCSGNPRKAGSHQVQQKPSPLANPPYTWAGQRKSPDNDGACEDDDASGPEDVVGDRRSHSTHRWWCALATGEEEGGRRMQQRALLLHTGSRPFSGSVGDRRGRHRHSHAQQVRLLLPSSLCVCILTHAHTSPRERNALSLAVLQELSAKLESIEKNPAARVVILRAEGPVFRCAASASPLPCESLSSPRMQLGPQSEGTQGEGQGLL